MKKLIQICSLLSLLVAFTVISAQAQTAKSYNANIPFEFSIGKQSYKPGNYVIRITENSPKSASLVLEDTEGNNLYKTWILGGNSVAQNDLKLIFDRHEDQLFLSKVTTHDKGFEIVMSGIEKRIAKEKRKANSRTEIALGTSKR